MIGQTLSHYRIEAELGRGGMGVVYRAHDDRLDRDVAIKLLPPQFTGHREARSRLIREARSVASLEHPHICSVFEIDETAQGEVFMVMPCYGGETLHQRLDRGPLPLEEVLSLGQQIGSALEAAHGRGIVHRDLKPENVMLTEGGSHALLMDFGLAKATDATQITRSGATLGTLPYLSPEQLSGAEPDARADLWALGVLLYLMITGRPPFRADTPAALLHRILHETPAPASRSRENLPVGLGRILEDLLEKDRERRPASADEIVRRLRAEQEALSTGRVETSRPRRRRTRRMRRPLLSGVVLVLAVAAIGFALRFWRPTEGIASLAVLPMEDLSPQGGDPYFADGMTDELINGLMKIPDLRVVSRRSVMRFRDSTMSIREIARDLRVDAVIEGSVTRSAGRVRISARLVEGDRESALWSTTLERGLSDVLHLQSELSQAIAREIRGALASEVEARLQRSRRIDPEAYTAFLRGMYWWNRDVQGMQQALEYFRSSVELDPSFAPAWAGMAQVYTTLGCHALRPPAEVRPNARAALRRAVELAPDDPDVLTAQAHYLFEFAWDFEAAERALRQAIEISPSHSVAHHILGVAILGMVHHRWDEAVDEMRVAYALDPLSPNLSADLAMMLRAAGRMQEASTQLARTAEMFPDWDSTRDRAAQFLAEGRPEESLALLESGTSEEMRAWALSFRIGVLSQLGRDEDARVVREELKELERGSYVPSAMWAMVNDDLGEPEEALRRLREALEEGSPWIPRLRSREWRSLQGDPRLTALLERVEPRE